MAKQQVKKQLKATDPMTLEAQAAALLGPPLRRRRKTTPRIDDAPHHKAGVLEAESVTLHDEDLRAIVSIVACEAPSVPAPVPARLATKDFATRMMVVNFTGVLFLLLLVILITAFREPKPVDVLVTLLRAAATFVATIFGGGLFAILGTQWAEKWQKPALQPVIIGDRRKPAA